MERLRERHEMLTKALDSLNSSLQKLNALAPDHEFYEEIRDSAIKRFEYSIDTFWKFLKEYLEKAHGIESIANPRGVFKKCADLKEMTEQESIACIKIIQDRNMTSHTYNIELAEEIIHDIPAHYKIMKSIITRIDLSLK